MSNSLYEILEIQPSATKAEIKTAYRRLAKKYHPDKNNNSEENKHKFVEIKNAYDILSDDAKRRNYDYGLDVLFEDLERDEYYRPPPPPFVYNKNYRYEFSKRTYFYGALFVVGITFIAFMFPAYLMITSANTHFEKGLAYYNAGMYSQAIDNFTKSINSVGGKSGLANYYNSYILFYHYHNYKITVKYIERSLEDIENDSLVAELLWMKGRCYQEAGKNEEALAIYSEVDDLGGAYDSALYYSGVIYSVNEHDYNKGLEIFNEFLDENPIHSEARYFKAYNLQKLEHHEEAIGIYDELLTRNFQSGAVHFHKALSELKLNLHEKACLSLDSAVFYRVEDAIKLKSIYCTNISHSYNAF